MTLPERQALLTPEQLHEVAACKRLRPSTRAAVAALLARIERLEGALRQASTDLRTVGDDYPGSSCHYWCHLRADAIDAALAGEEEKK